jgi:uncharacterized protein (TIGR03435 family)
VVFNNSEKDFGGRDLLERSLKRCRHCGMKAILALIVAFLVVSGVAGQPVPSPRGFEVASVKHSPSNSEGQLIMSEDAGRINYSNVALIVIVMRAYHTKHRQIVGPEWLSTERFDIVAKLSDGATKEDIPQMFQALLAERFKLTIHTEARMMPGYALKIAKGGPKMNSAGADEGMRRSLGPKGPQIKGKSTMAKLADVLSDSLDSPVVNMTGLNGYFKVALGWAAEEGAKMSPGQPATNGGPATFEVPGGPSIFTALQEDLGLKLEPGKTPLNFLIIDHVDKIPTAN